MNETGLQQFRQILLEEKQSLQAQQVVRETEHRRLDRIARIEGALRRVDAGDFGYCYVCDDEIDLQRLTSDPTTTRCLSCKSDDGAS